MHTNRSRTALAAAVALLCLAGLTACDTDAGNTTRAIDDQVQTNEDVAVIVRVTNNDRSATGGQLTLVAVGEAASGLAEVNDQRSVIYTPNPEFSGEDVFSYTVEDEAGTRASADVYVTVVTVNDPPTPVDDAAQTTLNRPVDIDVLANDTDAESETLFIFSVSRPLGGDVSVVGDGEDRYLRYLPTNNFIGTDFFTYEVIDMPIPDGGLVPEDAKIASAIVTVTVEAAGDAPELVDDEVVTNEDTPVTFDPLANDVFAGTLTITKVGQPAIGTAELLADGRVTYTPDANSNGDDAFVYTVEADNGWIVTGRVNVVVTPVNDPPSASNDRVVTATRPVGIDATRNDSDIDSGLLTITAIGTPSMGTATIEADNTVRYVPGASFTGEDSFTYTIADFDGASDSATVTVLYSDTCVGTNQNCNRNNDDGCEADTAADGDNCGACSARCGTDFACSSGTCVADCPAGFFDCDGNAGNGCEAELASDPANCGGCGTACGAGQDCADSACTGCAAGTDDCDGDGSNGCETSIATDETNCGACGAPCAAGERCSEGSCGTCVSGTGDCDGDTSNGCETSLTTNTACGGCLTVCTPETQRCSGGACTACAGTTRDCNDDPADGCEIDTGNDVANCGACGNPCAGGEVCAAGTCGTTCVAPVADCDGSSANGCEANFNDNATCGDCATSCTTPAQSCNGSSCVACTAGTGECDDDTSNGCEADLTSNATCGDCTTVCATPAQSCDGSACAACGAGTADCDGDAANGCEADLATEATCGDCATSCTTGQLCTAGVCI